MNRFLTTTATIALCTAWALTSVANADDAATPATPQATTEGSEPKTLQEAINIQVQNAKTLRLQGKIDDAGKALSQLMLVAPDDATVVAEYGKTLAQQGRSQDAVNFLARAAQMQPGDWTIFSALGVAYDQLDKRKEARGAYDRALALKPGEPSVINNYAVSRMLAGDYDSARKMLEQAQASGLSDPKIAGNLAKVEELQAAHPQAATSDFAAADKARAPTAPDKPVRATASLTKPPVAHDGVMMQRVPADPLAGPVSKNKTIGVAAVAAPKSASPAVAAQESKTGSPSPTQQNSSPERRPDGAIGIVSSLAKSVFEKITGDSDDAQEAANSDNPAVSAAQPVSTAVATATSNSDAKNAGLTFNSAQQAHANSETALREKAVPVPPAGLAEARAVTGAPRPLASAAPKAIAKLDPKAMPHAASTKTATATKKPKIAIAKAAPTPLSAPPSLRTASDSN